MGVFNACNYMYAYHIAGYIYTQGKAKTTSLAARDAPLQLPTIESTNKMMHLLLTDKFFATVVTAVIHSGRLHHRITPDQVNLS